MTDLEQAARQALEALEAMPSDDHSLDEAMNMQSKAIAALRRALEQEPADDEPVAIADGSFNCNAPLGTPLYTRPQPAKGPISDVTEAITAVVIEVEKLLCEKLGKQWRASGMSIQTLVDELATRPQPAAPATQEGWKFVPLEPTEEMLEAAHKGDREYTLRNFGDILTVMQGPYDHYVAMLSAAPEQPAAQWVGLTDGELNHLYATHHDKFGQPINASKNGWAYERAIEAKLREKNGGKA